MNDVNGVFVNLFDTYTETPIAVASRDRTFIFGTASKGPKHSPITPVSGESPETIYGPAPTDYSFETSLVRGYHEFASMTPNAPDVALIRVGNVKAARASLYENRAQLTGDNAPTDFEGKPSLSFYVDALEEGEKYNSGFITVNAFDLSGNPSVELFPTSLTIDIPGDDNNRLTKTYNLSKVPGAPGVYSSVNAIVNAINATPIFANKIRAGFTPIQKQGYEITITGLAGNIDRVYKLTGSEPGESWGNNLLSIDKAYVSKQVSQNVLAGSTKVDLNYAPNKVMESPQTIGKFIRVSKNEQILEISAEHLASNDITVDLYCKSILGWDSSSDISDSVSVFIIKNGSSVPLKLTEDVDYEIITEGEEDTKHAIGEVKLIKPAPIWGIGDRYYTSYEYEVSYAEAKTKSSLVSGSDRSYFIFGNSIIFGASQPTNLKIIYDSNVYFSSADIEITDSSNSKIRFINAANLPELGDTVLFDISYEPELPAPTGSTLTLSANSFIQNGAFVGGDDGRILSKRDYLKAVVEAMKAVNIYPRKRNVIMGLYLDDVEQGPNEETGMPELKPMNWFNEIFPLIEDVSINVSECSIPIPVRPPTDLSVDGKNLWLTRLVENSDTDIGRPANIIDSIDYYKADVIAATPRVSISSLLNGATYYANPAVVYAAMCSNIAAGESMTHRALPGSILGLGVEIYSAGLISKLNVKRYTSFVVSHTGKIIVADAPTLGLRHTSQFDRQFVRESIFLAVEVARVAAEKYIGKPLKDEYLTAMRKDVLKALSSLSKDVLSDFYVEIIPTAEGYITGDTELKMVLTTTKEIRTVTFNTYVKLGE